MTHEDALQIIALLTTIKTTLLFSTGFMFASFTTWIVFGIARERLK